MTKKQYQAFREQYEMIYEILSNKVKGSIVDIDFYDSTIDIETETYIGCGEYDRGYESFTIDEILEETK